jgi:ribosome-associated translation inhibitor RaiA
MIKVVFKNLEKSELAKEAAQQRLEAILEKFSVDSVRVTLSMENSPLQAGPDMFTAKLIAKRKGSPPLILEKSASNLYTALSQLSDHLLERLARSRAKGRGRRRKLARYAKPPAEQEATG